MIELTPYSKERFIEIYKSMRVPQLVVATFTGERGTTLFLNNKGGIVQYKLFIEDKKDYLWIEEQIHKHLDPHADLKRAYKEGAEIEVLLNGPGWAEIEVLLNGPGWAEIRCEPTWISEPEKYRIKGGISIAQWDKHKEAIKAWWRGEPIERKMSYKNKWGIVEDPGWGTNAEYRVALKPCPFCGSVDIHLRTLGNEAHIVCDRCGGSTGLKMLSVNTDADIRDAWNRRA